MKAELSSPWLQDFLRQRGGVLNIARRIVALG
jgi:hypothetical protein